jgi:hypothetical protein
MSNNYALKDLLILSHLYYLFFVYITIEIEADDLLEVQDYSYSQDVKSSKILK